MLSSNSEKKKLVRLVTDNHHYDDMLRQLNKKGYGDLEFTREEVEVCDVLIVLEYPTKDIRAKCYPSNVFLWSMEPPDEEWEWIRKCYKYFNWIITLDKAVQSAKIIYRQLAIPWQIEFSREEIENREVFSGKKKELSFITSNYAARKGHRRRLKYLERIRNRLDFDLWGRGFSSMQDKSLALLPYRYTILVENSSYPDYWSEKLADAFLCGCLPFYYGCTNIDEYFKPGSVIKIDINKPRESIRIINQAIQNNEWEKRKDLLIDARNKVLNEYQFFPSARSVIHQYASFSGEKKDMFIPELSHHPSNIKPLSLRRNYYLVKKALLRKRYLDPDDPFFGFTTYK